jgi:hypothetical protein
MAQLPENIMMEVNPMEWRQYQEEKMNLIVREEVLEFPLQNDFVLSHLIYQVTEAIYQQELQ